MIYKNRTMPNILKALQALNKRLPRNHTKKNIIEKELYSSRAGYAGELELDTYMTDYNPTHPYALLNDLYLHINGVYFQIDSLLITPTAFIVIEVKNYAEKTVVTKNPIQFIKVYKNGDRKARPNVINEVNRKIQHLEKWLNKRNIQPHIEGLITFAQTNELSFESPNPGMKILSTDEAPAYLESLSTQSSTLNEESIHNIAIDLAKHHEEYNPFPLVARYGIKPSDIMPGVLCPSCLQLGMKWNREKWNCQCGHKGKVEHLHTIGEWFMLIQPTITNREFRYFTRLANQNVARTLLKKSGLQKLGEKRTSHYIQRKQSLI
ncbi:nuclease-related domain-containing protein [Sporosarcina oncorhynchi]|uniref:Nuclease-related domain-containing protein n=1 Tax=Sporosarcina oncorhynchi TaxID=3056444 RepID=A0ABZ0L8R7_9BACL|nr:nuclease-related domain-containing protein [Sporosarcina sp. T2O-4]WOV88032.1 nuclease-related domain-containing protein [Sporosarcina sp. T2O-4]